MYTKTTKQTRSKSALWASLWKFLKISRKLKISKVIFSKFPIENQCKLFRKNIEISKIMFVIFRKILHWFPIDIFEKITFVWIDSRASPLLVVFKKPWKHGFKARKPHILNFIKNQDHPGDHPKMSSDADSGLSLCKRSIIPCLEKNLDEKKWFEANLDLGKVNFRWTTPNFGSIS